MSAIIKWLFVSQDIEFIILNKIVIKIEIKLK